MKTEVCLLRCYNGRWFRSMDAFEFETVVQANHPDLERHHCLITVARLLCSSDGGAKDAFWSLIQYTSFVFPFVWDAHNQSRPTYTFQILDWQKVQQALFNNKTKLIIMFSLDLRCALILVPRQNACRSRCITIRCSLTHYGELWILEQSILRIKNLGSWYAIWVPSCGELLASLSLLPVMIFASCSS